MTDSTNLWTGLLNDELYERTNEVGVFLTKMALTWARRLTVQ